MEAPCACQKVRVALTAAAYWHGMIMTGLRTFRSTISRPRISWPMLCPNPQRAPMRVALMLLLPMVNGVRACAQRGTFASTITHLL